MCGGAHTSFVCCQHQDAIVGVTTRLRDELPWLLWNTQPVLRRNGTWMGCYPFLVLRRLTLPFRLHPILGCEGSYGSEEVEALRIAAPLVPEGGQAENDNHPTLRRAVNDTPQPDHGGWQDRAEKR